MQTATLESGFLDPSIDAAYAWRTIMSAMARPGRISQVAGALPPAPLSIAASVALLTLCTAETPVFLAPGHDTPQVRDWLSSRTGAPFAAPEAALFAVGAWEKLPLAAFSKGSAEYPDRATTLIVEMPELRNESYALCAPCRKDQELFSLPELTAFQENAQQFPLGLDFIFTAGDLLAAMPRTTRIIAAGKSRAGKLRSGTARYY